MAENIEVLYVICRANCHAIDRMVDFAKENGVRKILFRPMRLFKNRHGAYMNDSLMPTDQEYQKAAALIAHYQTDLSGRISVQSVPFEQNSYDSRARAPFVPGFLPLPQLLHRVCAYGN